MDTNKFRLGLSYIFFESSKLGGKTKAQLINFIEKADEHQLKALAMDGDIVRASKLDENARSIIDDRFDSSIMDIMSAAALKGLKVATEAIKQSKEVLD